MPARSRRTVAVLTATAALGAALVVTAPAASAESDKHTDPAGDVNTIATGRGLPPEADSVDVLAVKDKYSRSSLKLRASMSDLEDSAPGAADISYLWAIEVNDGGSTTPWYARYYVGDGTGAGYADVYLGRGSHSRGRGCPIPVTLDQEADTITVKITRSCLGSPDSVRTGLVVTRTTSQRFGDDARQTGGATGRYDDIELGPTLLRGQPR